MTRHVRRGASDGKKIEVQSMAFYRLASGQIAGEPGQPDMLGLLQQIGAVPQPQVGVHP